MDPDASGHSALRALIASAGDSVSIYQQDLMGTCVPLVGTAKYDLELFDVIARKLADDVEVQIVLSTPGAIQGSTSFPFSNSENLQEVTSALARRLDVVGGFEGRTAQQVICENLQLSSIQHEVGESEWTNGHKISNHSKVVVVDDEAFYIGSKNLYPTTLQDYGFIVEDGHAASQLASEYQTQIWGNSADAASVDYATGKCEL